ncbi:MAG TPA: hypothetical protein VM141_13610, partial [Planctomycetota bacterium]|nr:hypothetical protein [Planctomycetota bacterium]
AVVFSISRAFLAPGALAVPGSVGHEFVAAYEAASNPAIPMEVSQYLALGCHQLQVFLTVRHSPTLLGAEFPPRRYDGV